MITINSGNLRALTYVSAFFIYFLPIRCMHMKQSIAWSDTLKNMFSDFPVWVIPVIVSILMGVVSGFFIKNFGKFFMLSLITFFIMVSICSYIGILTINVGIIKSFFGISSSSTVDSIFRLYLLWIRHNIMLCVGFSIGFFVGLKLG